MLRENYQIFSACLTMKSDIVDKILAVASREVVDLVPHIAIRVRYMQVVFTLSSIGEVVESTLKKA